MKSLSTKQIFSIPIFTLMAFLMLNTVSLGNAFAQEEEMLCQDGEVIVIKVNNPTPVCIDEDTALKWVELGIATIVKDHTAEEIEKIFEEIPLDDIQGLAEEEREKMAAELEAEAQEEIAMQVMKARSNSPLSQFNQGTSAEEVNCREGLILMVKESGKPVCASPYGFFKLIEKGYALYDLDIIDNHPEQAAEIIAFIMQNRDLKAMVIEKISERPEVLEKIKSNENIMSILEGKGLVGQGEAGAKMGGIMGSSSAGKGLGDMVGFGNGNGKMGNLIGGMVDRMLPKMMDGMGNSPTMGSQMRSNSGLMASLGS